MIEALGGGAFFIYDANGERLIAGLLDATKRKELLMADENTNSTETKTFTQEQVDAIVGDRLARARKNYADYDELKAQAAKYAELQESSKSELEKALERATKSDARIAELEKQIADTAAAAERQKLVNKIAKKYSVRADLKQFLTGGTEEELVEQAEILGGSFATPSKNDGKAQVKVTPTEDEFKQAIDDFFSPLF